jgi:hypothetical protein
MKVKVSEASGSVLDWLVATVEAFDPVWNEVVEDFFLPHSMYCYLKEFRPSTDWAQGGPIIEREKIDVFNQSNGRQGAIKMATNADPHPTPYFAETMLIAAMRCYVASKLGDEVEVPDELK